MSSRRLIAVISASLMALALAAGCSGREEGAEVPAPAAVADSTAAGQLEAASGGQPAPAFDPARLGTTERDITYCTVDGVPLQMDVYFPKTATGAFPAVMYVHGGGWSRGDKKDGAGAGDIPAPTDAGFLVVAVNYRLAPQYKFPAQIEDVKCAVRHLRANASLYNLDPEKIGAWGGSAGGHLVSLLGTSDDSAGLEGTGGYSGQSSRVQAVVDMFGPSDLTVDFEGGAGSRAGEQVFGASDLNSEILRKASPVTHVSADDPPFLILQGEKDSLVPPSQSQALYDRLVAAGVPAELVMVRNAGHGFKPSGGKPSPSRAEITRMMVEFFNQYLR